MDFGIETPHVKLAIELEGWDKTGNGQGKSKAEHDHFNRRLQSLSAQGWEVLPITNAQFHADPVHYILDISRRIDPRKFELPPVSRQPINSSPVSNVIPTPGTEQIETALAPTSPSTSNKNGVIWAVLAVGLVIAILVGIFMRDNYQPKITSPTSPPADMDCGDFNTRAEAQDWFAKYFVDFGDYAHLDSFANSGADGQACTSYKYKNE